MTIKLNQVCQQQNKPFLDSIDDNFEIKNKLATHELPAISVKCHLKELSDLKELLNTDDNSVALNAALQ